jgi:pilus assembly protein CpaB
MDRQRILILFGVAWLSAALLTWFVYAKTQVPREEKKVAVMAAAADLPVGTLLKKGDLKAVRMPEHDVPKRAVFHDKEALGRVLLYPMTANEPLTLAKLSNPTSAEGISSTIDAGYRAVSVQVTDASSVAGLIQPGSRVDVLFTRPGNMTEAITSTILQNVKVLAVGRITQVGQTVDPRAPKMPVATLVVTPAEAQKLELAKNQGKISLVLRNPQDSTATPGGPVTTEVLDPAAGARIARARNARAGAANLGDPKLWQDLASEKRQEEEARRKKEAEKPRFVVDVYRGDKHVQELFR